MNLTRIEDKKRQLDQFQPMPADLVKNLENWFRVELTYTSNAIEGNTLTRRETAVVLEKGTTVANKSLVEHLEATNHAKALDYTRSLSTQKPFRLSNHEILLIHAMILKSIDDDHAGRYRTLAVRISGSAVILPNPRKVPDLMNEFQTWLEETKAMHPLQLAAEAHYRFVSIHPFVDGNGRTGRLLMNCLLMAHGYPPAIIRKRDRLAYISALEKAQLGGSKDDYERLILQAVERSLDIYLKATQGESSMEDIDREDLLKIGELASQTGENVSTIRHWTQVGLLEVEQVTESGYQLYAHSMIEHCKKIQHLKQERLTLAEIKLSLKKP